MGFAPRTPDQLLERQRLGTLRVCTALDFRRRVASSSLEQAYADTDVLAAASCDFTDQGQIWISLGPCDPPLRIRQARLGGISAGGGYGAAELCLPLGGSSDDPQRRGGSTFSMSCCRGSNPCWNCKERAQRCNRAGSCKRPSAVINSARRACCWPGASRKTALLPSAAVRDY